MSNRKSADEFVGFFSDGKPHTVEELTEYFGFSRITAFRKLKSAGALTSVNSRGQYYILGAGLKFNCYGLVTLNGKVFYRGGNLLKAIVHLVNNSRNGMKTVELERLLGTNIRIQVASLMRQGKLYRKKQGRGYCYFSADRQVRDKQLAGKCSLQTASRADEWLESESPESLHEIIMIMLTYIKNPRFSPKSIALSLVRRGMNVNTRKVNAILEKYDLAKKKS